MSAAPFDYNSYNEYSSKPSDTTYGWSAENNASVPQEVFADDGDEYSCNTMGGSENAVQFEPENDLEFDVETHVVPENVEFDPDDQAKIELELMRAACGMSLSDKLTAASGTSSARRSQSKRAPLAPVPEPDVACYDAINAGLNKAQLSNAQAPAAPPLPGNLRPGYEQQNYAKVPVKPVPPFVFVHDGGPGKVSVGPADRMRPRRCTMLRMCIVLFVLIFMLSIATVVAALLKRKDIQSQDSEAQVKDPNFGAPVSQSSPTATPQILDGSMPTAQPIVQQTLPPMFDLPTEGTSSPHGNPAAPAGSDPPFLPMTAQPTSVFIDVTHVPTIAPTQAPVARPPTFAPTVLDVTPRDDTTSPTIDDVDPTRLPRVTQPPTISTQVPTRSPSKSPTYFPTKNPTSNPTIRITSTPTKEPTFLPTLPPTLPPTAIAAPASPIEVTLRDIIAEAAPDSYPDLLTAGTSQILALQWLAAEDSVLNLIAGPREKLIQRWVFAVLYYAAGGSGWYQSAGWLSASDECSWFFISNFGAACSSDGLIRAFDLEGNNLVGTLPREIGLLGDTLRFLYLRDNWFTGPIPSEVGRLQRLERLVCTRNQLTGSLPTEIGGLTSVSSFGFGRNQLVGPIPSEMGQMTRLSTVGLERNQLTGSLPQELGNLSRMRFLNFDFNDLSGQIPSTVGTFGSLDTVKFNGNSFVGSVPSEICLLASNSGAAVYVDCDEVTCNCCVGCPAARLSWGDRNLRAR